MAARAHRATFEYTLLSQPLRHNAPGFHARFAVPASLAPDKCFCLHDEHTAAFANIITSHGQRVQLLPTEEWCSFARAKVMVHEQFDGRLSVFFQEHTLPIRPAPVDPVQVRKLAPEVPRSNGP